VRVNGASRHFFNPSNFGIAATLLVFPWIGIAPPYQFTEGVRGPWDWLVPILLLASGLMLNLTLTKKGPLIAAWLGGFAAQAVCRSIVFGSPMVAGFLPMTGVAFILFTSYMITDPGTTPSSVRGQVAFGLAAAAAYAGLVANHVVFGLFFALVIVSGLRGVVIALDNLLGRADRPVRRLAPVPVSGSLSTDGARVGTEVAAVHSRSLAR
jgi:hypothetical protein